MAATAAAPALANQTTTRSAPATAPATTTILNSSHLVARWRYEMHSPDYYCLQPNTVSGWTNSVKWNNALTELLTRCNTRFFKINTTEALTRQLVGNFEHNCHILVEPARADAFLDLIRTTLPALTNPNRITITTTPQNNKLITIAMTGQAPTIAPPLAAAPSSTPAPAATKTSG